MKPGVNFDPPIAGAERVVAAFREAGWRVGRRGNTWAAFREPDATADQVGDGIDLAIAAGASAVVPILLEDDFPGGA